MSHELGHCDDVHVHTEDCNKQEATLKAELQSVGFDLTDLSKLVDAYGQEVLAVISKALSAGFSKALIMELLQLGGKIFLELLSDWKLVATRTDFKAVIEGEDVDDKHIEEATGVLDDLIKKYLPIMIDYLGPVLLNNILPLILKLLVK